MPTSLQDCPPELLAHIVLYLETTPDLLRLSLSCKKLHSYIERDGYRVFVQNQYPVIPTPPIWKAAAHALSRQLQGWERKSLFARCLQPPREAEESHHGYRGRRARGQTMGYQPTIASYESWTGSTWTSRKEVVAWGAGATLILRVRWMGPDVLGEWKEVKRRGGDLKEFDQHRHKCRWWKIKDPAYEDGRDDITTVKLLGDSQNNSRDSERVIVGRATGDLIIVKVKHDDQHSWKKEVHFTHSGQTVRFACISCGPRPAVVVCLGDSTIAVYHVRTDKEHVEPTGIVQVPVLEKSCRIWSLVFLRHNCLAVGLGPSMTPIRIYEIGSDEIPSQPIRALAIGVKKHTAYSLAPLPHSTCTPGTEGNLFLSGGYDGVVRLHDLGSPLAVIASFSDPVDSISAIYTLLPLGHGRFLAGSANYSILKVFDISTTLDNLWAIRKGTYTTPKYNHHRNWNVFLVNEDHSAGHRAAARESSSSVYSLSSPSLASPTIFAGIEGKVIQIDVASTNDPFPDPVLNMVGYAPSDGKMVPSPLRWDPHGEAMCLAMYKQTSGAVRLKKQVRVGKTGSGVHGLDERWTDV